MTETASVGSWEAISSLGQRSDSSGGEKSDECDLDEQRSHQEHLRLAGIVKGVHADLRNKYRRTGESELEKIWYEHCQNKPPLSQYADAMHHLAVDHWSKNQETRIDWCREVIDEFFKRDGLRRVLEKEKRRKEILNNEPKEKMHDKVNGSNEVISSALGCKNVADVSSETSISSDGDNNNDIKAYTAYKSDVRETRYKKDGVYSKHWCNTDDMVSNGCDVEGASDLPHDCQLARTTKDVAQEMVKQYNIVDVPVEGRIRLLDVGSCFNPFLAFPEIQAVGIDISPATDSVFHCDFLHLRTTDPLQVAHDTMTTFINNLHDPVEWLPRECFHVVVFSLLLEYFPAPYQRWISCQKAHELLMYNGILVIVTPDSSHQNRNAGMMKSWKVAIESIGFKRWRYVKQEHLHCMVFRKVAISDQDKRESLLKGITPDMIFIPQDFNNVVDDYDTGHGASAYCYEDEQFYRDHTLHELPMPSSDSDEN